MRGNRLYKKLDAWVGQAGIVALSAVPAPRVPALDARFEPTAILVVKLSALGDTILLVPALRELRRRYPAARIGMLGTGVNRGIAAELTSFIDEFHMLEPGRAVRDPGYLARFVAGLRRGRWELGIDFDQWTNITPVLLRLAGVPARVGFRTDARARHRLYTHTEPRRGDRHEAENFLALLRPLGIRRDEAVLELPVRPEAAEWCRGALAAAGWNGTDPLVAIHPGCGGHGSPRAWPLERYRELCARLARREPLFFLFTGTGVEGAMARELAGEPAGRGCALTDTTLPQFVAALSLASVVVSGNTGAMHVAAALGVPQVALHGPTNARKWGPLNPRAQVVLSSCPGCPCLDMGWEFHRTDGFCMEQIPVDAVYQAAVQGLEAARPQATPAPRGVEPAARFR